MTVTEWIKEQRKLLDAATPRPWRAYTSDKNKFSEIQVWEKNEHTLTLAVADNHIGKDRENFILMAQAPTSLEKALAIIELMTQDLQSIANGVGVKDGKAANLAQAALDDANRIAGGEG